MEFTEREYRELFLQGFPNQLLRSHLLAIIDGYRSTPGAVKKALEFADRHDAFGMVRRGKIDEQLRGVADLNKLRYTQDPNSVGSCYFLSVFSGKFRLVALLGGNARRIRPAKIRRTWARYNEDGRWSDLFPEQQDPVPADAVFVAFLLHGPRGRRRDQPGYVHVVIPDSRCRAFICRFDLFKMFPDVAMGLLKATELVRKEPKPKKGTREKRG
jgi:hypothetical protein